MKENINYYELLGISKGAHDEDITRAYRVQAKKWHPDVNNDTTSGDIFKQLVNARDTLLDPVKRGEYDESLVRKATPLHKKNNAGNDSTYEENYTNEEKQFYTKGEYFKLYLKYYQVSKLRKFFAIIFVGLETLLCSILRAINYVLVVILAYSKEFLSYGAAICAFIYIALLFIKYNFMSMPLIPDSLTLNISLIALLIL